MTVPLEKLELFYEYNWRELVGVTTYWCDLRNKDKEKVGILITNRFINIAQNVPSGFNYTPYNFVKTIIIPDGILETSGITIENTQVPLSLLEKQGVFNKAKSCDKEYLGTSEDGNTIFMKLTVFLKQ